MAFETEASQDWLAVIGRGMAMLVLHVQDMNNASITEKAQVLLGLGLTHRDAAAMLGSTDASLRELLRVAKKSKGKKNGKRKNR